MTGLPGLLLERANTMAAKTALRSHQLGIWEPTSWTQLRDESASVGMGLLAIGAAAGDVVAVIADNHASAIAAEFGAQGVGLVTLLVNAAASTAAVVQAIRDHHVTVAVVGDQEQHDKLLENIGNLDRLKRVVVMDTRGLRHLDDIDADSSAKVISYARLRTAGNVAAVEWASNVAALVGTDPAAILGGVAVSHDALVSSAHEAVRALGLTPKDSTHAVATLADPKSHALLAASLAAGFPVHVSKSATQAVRDLRAVRPTVLVAPPTVLAAIKADADARARNTKGLRKAAYDAGLRRGAKDAVAIAAQPPVMLFAGALIALAFVVYSAFTIGHGPVLRVIVPLVVIGVVVVGLAISGMLTTRPLRNRYGLGAARAVLVPDQGTPDDVGSWFRAIGVPLRADGVLSGRDA